MGYPISKTWLSMAAVILAFTVGTPGAALGEIDCTCRYGGQSYAQDACVCLMTPNGARLACCGKVLNNASWNFTGDMCPTASAPAAEGKPPAIAGYAALSRAGTGSRPSMSQTPPREH